MQNNSDRREISLEQCITSDAVSGKRCIDQLLWMLKRMQWAEDDVFGVHLAFEEALVNAIKHGNQNDPSKTVRIVYKVSPVKVRLEITDEGDGFEVQDIPDPTDDENLEVPSGRGLMLMRTFMSTVEFNGQGNGVVMEKESTPYTAMTA